MVSRDRFDSPVPRQPAHLHTQAESDAYLRDFSRFPRRRPFIYLCGSREFDSCENQNLYYFFLNGKHENASESNPTIHWLTS